METFCSAFLLLCVKEKCNSACVFINVVPRFLPLDNLYSGGAIIFTSNRSRSECSCTLLGFNFELKY